MADLCIGGQWVAAKSGQEYERIAPYSGQVASTNVSADARDADRAIEAAEAAFLTWSTTGPNRRRDLLNRAADLILERRIGAAVFYRDIGRAMNFARQVKTGICHINGPTIHDEPQRPFGGTKASGYGRFGGKAGINEFTELR